MVLLSVCLVVSPSVLIGCSPCHLSWLPFLLVRIYRFATVSSGVHYRQQVDGGLQAASGNHGLLLDRSE